MFRCTPEQLENALESMLSTIRSDKWREAWWRVEDISANLIDNNQLIMNEDLIDINEWNQELEDMVEVEMVESSEDKD